MEGENDSSKNMGCWLTIIIGIIIGVSTGIIAIPMALIIGAIIILGLNSK